jgi:putative nucleotidyltransferase with HDIG domain
MDMRDRETEGHSQRVTELTLALARMMGLSDRELSNIRRGALLHDIGKMGIPDAILMKQGALTDEEWALMKKHPLFAHEMIAHIQYLQDALDIPQYHHEKWDGTGYPYGLKGEQIPLPARIFAIVDIWDALRSDRPYRPAWSAAKALKYIRSISGTHLDPKVVQIFLESKIYEKK